MTSPTQADAVALGGWARDFLAAPRMATLAVAEESGWPLQAVVWYDLREGGIVVNSAVGRRWPAILLRDGRASLLVEDGYTYVSVRALAEVLREGEEAQADIAALAHRYLDAQEAEALIRDRFRGQQRVSFMLRPVWVAVHGRPSSGE